MRDISERARLEVELTRQALHGSLTGLPNRTLFLDRLDHALSRAARPDSPVTVLFVDLDGFKTVNGSLGHEVGDRLLVTVADRLHRALRPSDSIARLGGDEFAVLLEDTETSGAITVAERFTATLAASVVIDTRQIFVRASIGIATSRPAACTAGELLRDADLAMYMAKRRQNADYVVFEATMHHAALEGLELEADLRRALPAGEMLVHIPNRSSASMTAPWSAPSRSSAGAAANRAWSTGDVRPGRRRDRDHHRHRPLGPPRGMPSDPHLAERASPGHAATAERQRLRPPGTCPRAGR